MGASPAPTGESGQAALLALSNALTVLARRLRTGAVAADDFARLKARATAIAAQVWELRTTRWAFVENAAKLADDLVAFAEQTRDASARAAAMVSGNVAVIETLEVHAARIAALHVNGGTDAVLRREAIRAELQPLEATMVAFRARLAVEHSASEEAKGLARRASVLAECALGLRGGGRSGGGRRGGGPQGPVHVRRRCEHGGATDRPGRDRHRDSRSAAGARVRKPCC